MFRRLGTFGVVLMVLLAPAVPAQAGGGRWRSRTQAPVTESRVAAANNSYDRRDPNARANAIYPKFNGAFHSKFYTTYGYPSGTYGLRGLPW